MRNDSKISRVASYFTRLEQCGVNYADAQMLRRLERVLNSWSTRRCNGEIQEVTEGQFCFTSSTGVKTPIVNAEDRALEKLQKIMHRYPRLWYYYQRDPRGCSLYVGPLDILPSPEAGLSIQQLKDHVEKSISLYYTRGIPCHV